MHADSLGPAPRTRSWRSVRLKTLFLITAMSALLAFFAGEALRHVRDLAKRNTCSSHLRIIAAGMENYYGEFGRFPPPFIADDDGRPLHSWRVLLLKYLEPEFYERYDFSEPWDGPHNRRLIEERPSIYGCPADRDGALRGETNYVLVTGPDAAFSADRVNTPMTSSHSSSATVLVVETCQSGIYWSEPRDLDMATMDVSIGKSTGRNISSRHYGGALVIESDMDVHFLPSSLHEPHLRSLFGWSEERREAVARRVFGEDR